MDAKEDCQGGGSHALDVEVYLAVVACVLRSTMLWMNKKTMVKGRASWISSLGMLILNNKHDHDAH